MDSVRVCLLGLLCCGQIIHGTEKSYSAVVVEFSPATQPAVDAQTNILDNVAIYVQIIKNASMEMMADIIVFPEAGLKGYYNQEAFVEVPNPADGITLCAHNTTYEAPLIQLSCAARATNTYVVVNLGERSYNSTTQSTLYFNTDVVFDRNGIIIARYRKIHLFGENGKSPSPDKEPVYFDTDFGVRFGLMICFDIIFQDPGLQLTKLYNISHFIFTTAWFSEMPFLTAIQEQWYWSYTADAVLLAAGYNFPSVGSTGSGIYLGKQGIAAYNMTETVGSFMLHADLPVPPTSPGKLVTTHSSVVKGISTRFVQIPEQTDAMGPEQNSGGSPNVFKTKRDFLNVYNTEQIVLPAQSESPLNGSEVTVRFAVNKTICQNSLCCDFSLEISSVWSTARPNTSRGDDYSQLYYRLAVFDGVRNYDDYATGGLQTCAVIPCVNSDIQSCGLRSDDSSAIPNSYLPEASPYTYYQTEFVFNRIVITGNFTVNNSFVGPNVLLKGENDNFGSLMLPDDFIFSSTEISTCLQTVSPVPNLVVASVYGRVFTRDGQKYTGSPSGNSSGFSVYVDICVLIISVMVLKYTIT